MAIDNFEYTHPNGWEDSVNFPTTPANETQTRQLLQEQHKEVRDYLKTKLVPGVNEHLAEFVQQLSVNGYQKLPNGLILQWGTLICSPAGTDVVFPLAFPNDCFGVFVVPLGGVAKIGTHTPSKTSVTMMHDFSGSAYVKYFAIGH